MKEKLKVKNKVGQVVSTKTQVILGVLMLSATFVGLSFAALAIEKPKAITAQSSCTPTPPRLSVMSKDTLSHIISLSHMPTSGGIRDVIVFRSQELPNNVWSSWEVLSNSHKTSYIATDDLSAYPNKHYQYKAIAYGNDCLEASKPSDIVYVSTYDFMILEDEDNGDPFYRGIIRDINLPPYYNNSEFAHYGDIVRLDMCFGYPGAEKKVRDYYLVKSGGPMGNNIRLRSVECERGCYEGRCTYAGETCEPGWHCLSASSRGYVDSTCNWVEAENVPGDDFQNYRCRGGDFVYIGDRPVPPPSDKFFPIKSTEE